MTSHEKKTQNSFILTIIDCKKSQDKKIISKTKYIKKKQHLKIIVFTWSWNIWLLLFVILHEQSIINAGVNVRMYEFNGRSVVLASFI